MATEPEGTTPDWERVWSAVLAMARQLVPTGSIQDTASETMLRVARRFVSGSPVNNWTAFARSVCKNVTRATLKRRGRGPKFSSLEDSAAAVARDEARQDELPGDAWEILYRALEELRRHLTAYQNKMLTSLLATGSIRATARAMRVKPKRVRECFQVITRKLINFQEISGKHPPPPT